MSSINLNQPSRSLWEDSVYRLKQNKSAMVSLYFIIFLCLVAIFARFIAPYSYETQNMDAILQGPSAKFWFGTDSLGRDQLSRLIYGARMSMAVAIFTAVISLIIGSIYGAISGWFGGIVDRIMMRIVDLLFSIPTLVLMILVKVIFDSLDLFDNPELKALTSILMALSLASWVTLARVVRGQVLQAKEMLYVEAAHSIGAKPMYILWKHIIPNIMGPVIILLTLQVPNNILFESFLSFLGLGLQPPFSSWGVLSNEGWALMKSYPHLIIAPSVAMALTLFAFSFLGDGLRDAFDPKMRGRI